MTTQLLLFFNYKFSISYIHQSSYHYTNSHTNDCKNHIARALYKKARK